MALKEITLSSLVDGLDEIQSEYADFFRPMLGYEAILTLYDGIEDDVEPLLLEIEDEVGFEFPSDLVSFYMCSNGGKFGELTLFPLSKDTSLDYEIHYLNVIDKTFKTSLGIDKNALLIGGYLASNNYITCILNDDEVYSYQLWDANKKKVIMEFEEIAQVVALEVSYITDYDGLMDFNSNEGNK